MYSIIQDTWDETEDQELRDYVKEKKYLCKYLSKEEILEEPITNIDVLFYDTDIVQEKIKDYYQVPDTYPDFLQEFYKRTINKIKFSELENKSYPYFAKPTTNNKSFTGLVVSNKYNYEYIKSNIKSQQELIYIADVVDFLSEFRLFIGNGKVYGIGDTDDQEHAVYEHYNPPPKDFIENLLKKLDHKFYVIDVGILDTNNWAIVEVNPPFAIDSYELPMEQYYKYCCDAWKSIIFNSFFYF